MAQAINAISLFMMLPSTAKRYNFLRWAVVIGFYDNRFCREKYISFTKHPIQLVGCLLGTWWAHYLSCTSQWPPRSPPIREMRPDFVRFFNCHFTPSAVIPQISDNSDLVTLGLFIIVSSIFWVVFWVVFRLSCLRRNIYSATCWVIETQNK